MLGLVLVQISEADQRVSSVTPLKVGESFAPILVDDRFYYVNGFERYASQPVLLSWI